MDNTKLTSKESQTTIISDKMPHAEMTWTDISKLHNQIKEKFAKQRQQMHKYQ